MNGMRWVWRCGAAALLALPRLTSAELMIVGNDQKVTWDDAGQPVFSAPGEDSISIVDIGADPENPEIVADLDLMNSIFGPPTNLATRPTKSSRLRPTR